MRCEDYPCCGHADDPGGCPDFSRTVRCKGCGTKFHPDELTENYCYACQNYQENENEYWDEETE